MAVAQMENTLQSGCVKVRIALSSPRGELAMRSVWTRRDALLCLAPLM
jgi:hypothetical protein